MISNFTLSVPHVVFTCGIFVPLNIFGSALVFDLV